MAKKRITMADIAHKAGVTTATVSMALRNHPRVSKKTQQKIQQLAAAMGYTPDPLVQALMAQRGNRSSSNRLTANQHAAIKNLAIVSLWPEDSANPWPNDPLYQPYHHGMQERAHELGYETRIFPCDTETHNIRKLTRTLDARGIKELFLRKPMPQSPPFHLT